MQLRFVNKAYLQHIDLVIQRSTFEVSHLLDRVGRSLRYNPPPAPM